MKEYLFFKLCQENWFLFFIIVFFADPQEKPATVFHHLRLFPTDVSAATADPEKLRQETVIHEQYDEIVGPSLGLFYYVRRMFDCHG